MSIMGMDFDEKHTRTGDVRNSAANSPAIPLPADPAKCIQGLQQVLDIYRGLFGGRKAVCPCSQGNAGLCAAGRDPVLRSYPGRAASSIARRFRGRRKPGEDERLATQRRSALKTRRGDLMSKAKSATDAKSGTEAKSGRAHVIAGGFPPGSYAGHDHDYAS